MFGNYGTITEEMDHIIRRHVRGKEVWDLGAGSDCRYTQYMLDRGARKVVPVEKEPFFNLPKDHRVYPLRAAFDEVTPPQGGIDVAWLSWPCNRRLPGIVPLLQAARVVLYAGCNVNGSACGGTDLWKYLIQRQLEDHFHYRNNTLLVYTQAERTRPLVAEEYAAIFNDKMFTLEEARERAGVAELQHDSHEVFMAIHSRLQ